MKIVSGATALFAAIGFMAAIATANAGSQSDSSMQQGSSPGGQQSQQQSSSVMGDQKTVKDVQQALNNQGYNAGPADGKWTSKSQDALSKFQRDKGLRPTGEINQESLVILGVASPSEPGSAGAGGQSSQPGSMDQQQSGSGGQMNRQKGSNY